jgi:Divergent InlB B-repeat domain
LPAAHAKTSAKYVRKVTIKQGGIVQEPAIDLTCTTPPNTYSTTCKKTVHPGQRLSLTATSQQAFDFKKWTQACKSTPLVYNAKTNKQVQSDVCKLRIAARETKVTAVFEKSGHQMSGTQQTRSKPPFVE